MFCDGLYDWLVMLERGLKQRVVCQVEPTSGTVAKRGGEDKGAGDDLTMVLQSGTEGPVLRAFSRIFPEIVTELQEDPSLRRRGGGAGAGRGGDVGG